MREPDVRVLCSNGLKGVMEAILPVYQKESGRHVTIEYGASASLKRSIDGGAAFDLAILTPQVIAALTSSGSIVAGTATDVAKTNLAVGMRKGAARSDISTAAGLKQRLLAAKSITYSKEGAATATFNDTLARLGIADAVAARIVLQTVSGASAESVAAGQNELVFAPVSEILVAGAEVLGVFPAEFQSPLIMTAGIGVHAKDRTAAMELVQFLLSPKAVSAITASGMEPLSK